MRAYHPAVAALAGVALLAAPALSQTAEGAPPHYTVRTVANSHVADGSSAALADPVYRSSLGPMRSDLRNLLMAQEMYWAANKTYAGEVGLLSSYHATPGVEIQIVRAHADGWTARAVLPRSGGKSCVIWSGGVGPTERLATEMEHKTYPEAEVSCDGDGLSAHSEWASAERSYMTFALRTLARSQEKYRALNATFAQSGNALDQFVWDPGVTVTILTATATGWSARATYAGVPGKSCVLWRGDVPAAAVPHTDATGAAGDKDQVICDEL